MTPPASPLRRLSIIGSMLFAVAAGPAVAAPDPGASNLQEATEAFRDAVAAGDKGRVVEMTAGFLPTPDQIAEALGPGASDTFRDKILAFHQSLPRDPDTLAGLISIKPEQTEVQVHGATTEEIAAYAEGSPAWEEFPGGAKDLAVAGVLKPGTTFYEVEFLKPGEDAGMKYHLFFWNGSGWSMLGPVWRALQ